MKRYPGESSMTKVLRTVCGDRRRRLVLFGLGVVLAATFVASVLPALAQAQETGHHRGGEANLVLPDLGQVQFLGMSGRTLLML
jgi:hypothetical protein